MTSVDLVVLGVMFLSGIIAFTRGLVREILSVAAWVGAVAAAMALAPAARSYVGPHVPSPEWTEPVSFVVLFLIALIIFSLIAKTIANAVRASAISGLDRTLGLVFGLARGAALAIAAYILACMAFPPEHWPPQVLEARSLPFIYSGAAWVARMMPPEYPLQVPPPPSPAGRQASMDEILKASPAGRAIDPPIRGIPPHG
jgi:membrane protein required for colicin V production